VAQPEPLIRFETEPGRQMQADFATIRRGKDRLAVFIATLGWSRTTYVEFVTDERMETLLGCHERAFFFGGNNFRLFSSRSLRLAICCTAFRLTFQYVPLYACLLLL
jgi:transposase